MDDETERRIGRNEALFREANEAIERGLWPGQEHSSVRFRCECSQLECGSAVELSLSAYQAVRQHPRRFIVLPGHELPDVEDVIDQRRGYAIVEKHGLAGAVAAQEDPRS